SKQSGRWGPYRQASPPPARHHPGARSARRRGRRHSNAGQHRNGEPTVKRLSWLNGLKPAPAPRRGARRKPAGRKLFLETLDERTLPSFLGPVNYAAGYSPQGVVAADFNGDGRLDVAVASNST